MTPALTIGLPIHNPGAFLKPALQSIFAQTFQDWELILVDDGSTDGSTDLLSSIRDPRVRVLKSGSNRGLAARLNQIVQAARAPYIARMDADDMMDSDRLERQVMYLRAHPDVDVVGCGLVILSDQGQPQGLRLFGTEHASICRDPLYGTLLVHGSVVGKTEWFRRHPYNEENRTCEDWELWFSSYKTSRFANLGEPLYFYREFAPFSIRRYVGANHRIAGLEWRERKEFGLLRTARACLSQYIRAALNVVAYIGNFQDYTIRRRTKPIDNDTRARVLAVTEKTLRVALPLDQTNRVTSNEFLSVSQSPPLS